MHLFGFIIKIYHGAWSSECQNIQIVTAFYRIHNLVVWTCTTKARLTHTFTYRFPTVVPGINVWISSITSCVCSSDSQELACILWNSRSHYRVHKSLPPSPVKSLTDPILAIPTDWIWSVLTLILLTWRIWWAPNNASRWQMGFNSAFNP